VTDVEVIQETADWPTKAKEDVAWVYVALSGDGFSEAVNVLIAREDGHELIRSVEWGRP
jgi:hypothetical protein